MTAIVLSFAADAAVGGTTLTWVPGSTVKVEQMIGECDYTAQAKTGQCTPTASRTLTRAKVLGTDLGASFESQGKLIFLFGDTTGPTEYFASDTMASTISTNPDTGLVLDFFTNTDGTPYFLRVPGVRLGAAEVPHAGIRLENATYVAFNSGVDINLADPNSKAYSVLTRFDESARRFTLLRTISSRPDGKFITTSLYRSGSDIVIFGLSAYRASDVYLSIVPASTFESGAGTRYFSGLVNGQPTWSTSESAAVPLFIDPQSTKTIGNHSVTFSQQLGLWLMTYDGGTPPNNSGIYFTYATAPWGPWSDPQLIFSPRRDGALGTYIHDPSIVPSDGLNGPTIGQNDPVTTRGGFYAPYMIERFTRVNGNKLSIYYTGSTWNPYTIVLMRSDLTIGTALPRRRTARH
jgi:hypothetical protein